MTIGKIKWFNDVMGFGVIAPDNGKEELFASFYSSDLNGLKFVREGQQVRYEIVQGPRGKQATNIQTPAGY